MFIIAPVIKMINIIGAVCESVRMVSHLGINPVRGGIPPSERSIVGIIICIVGDSALSLLN